ncbi:PhnD/SsuA/transferrin family substrate-binding protein [Oceanivirga miroungae]|uniref:Phosphonate ABC transporter substrate-binding protein n=1 Tax=Oceanivirga miroungae TaxID=1130046 RepID=A0A6I8MCF7_9FUSO|nr:PhnD/SsuA/transferrin family substrate-binding protein [Oceanivirga miroungae]VWL85923.1 hypothetical protein OMES3154_01208 [Oceanivirga miroungae]
MKKKMLLTGFLASIMLVSCGSGNETVATNDKNVDTIKIQFVPSRDPGEIITATKPLEGLLKQELSKKGFEVDKIEVSVGTTYEAVGEALSAGSVDLGLIPGGTLVTYKDGAEVLLTATRNGVSVESEKAIDWNKNKPTTDVEEQVTFYRGLILAGPSKKGRELAKKVNAGEKLTWEDLNSAKWGVRGVTSSSGYIYPYIWLQDNYGKNITNLDSVVEQANYGAAFAALASDTVDVITIYADARKDYGKLWTSQFGRKEDIFSETNVIGVTDRIYNDTVSVSTNSETINSHKGLKEALADSFIEMAKTDEGKKVIKIYSHKGYKKAKMSDYDKEEQAQNVLKELKPRN